MSEEKTKKKREWVKNAAIIFLAIMLVLTFFSNTIMNRSLPEVAAQYVESGAISATIRGTGAIEANEKFSVSTETPRKVLSVPVKEGDTVAVGDTLILFAEDDGGNDERLAAQDALDAALLTYKKALLKKADGTYSKEQRAIEKAQTALDKAKAEQKANVVSDADIAAAQKKVTTAQKDVDTQQALVDKYEAQAGSGSDNTAQIAAKLNEKTVVEAKLDAAKVSYKTEYANYKTCALAWKTKTEEDSSVTKKDISIYEKALCSQLQRFLKTDADNVTLAAAKPTWWPSTITYDLANVQGMIDAYTTINGFEEDISALNTTISNLRATDNSGESSSLASARTKLATLNATLTTAKTALTTLNDKRSAYDAATEAVYTNQNALEEALDALADAKIADKESALDLENLQKEVSKATQKLNSIKSGSGESSIKSTVNGVVSSINVSSGNAAEANSELMLVEVPDLGYSVSISVTKEQAKKVRVGDSGTLSGYGYYGTTARLSSVRTDPQKAATNKLLVFDLSGDNIDSGSNVTISIGEKSAQYDTIVPNSAVRSDSNGSFVLAVITKSSPLSNRYIATRIDVEVVAKDDTNTAVSGGLTTGDFVITTSTKPIEAGTQVRLADNG